MFLHRAQVLGDLPIYQQPHLHNSTEDRIEVGFPHGFCHASLESACQAGDVSSVPEVEDPLEKEIANQSSILAWEIPWTEEPGELPSIRLQESQTGLSN